jgi:predicted permease
MIRRIHEALSRLLAVFRRQTLDQDFNEEFSTHIDLLTKENERRGLDRDEARRRAILQMGGLNATKDLHRDARGLPPLDRFLDMLWVFGHDLAHAVRSLAKARAFTFVCVASLGIGMGTVIVILIVMRMFGAPPAGINTEGLVQLLVRPQAELRARLGGDDDMDTWSYPDYSDVRDADTGMTLIGWTGGQSAVRLPGEGTRHEPTLYVSSNYFKELGVALARGPGFNTAVDEGAAAQPAVIISQNFWQRRLGSDPNILGKTIALNRLPHVVVGIAPEGFYGHLNSGEASRTNLWVPLRQHPRIRSDENLRFNRETDWVRIHGRLSAGVSIEQANAAVSGIMAGLAERYPSSNQFKSASVEPYFVNGASARGDSRSNGIMLLAVVGMVLLVVCLNVSGMMLVRSAMRERELSIRQAIGAARGQLIRYLFSEAIVLATLAGSLASAVLLGVPALIAWWIKQPLPPGLRPDALMLVSCIGLCLLTSLMFGLLPALRFSRPSLVSALKDDVGGGGRRVGRVHRLAAAIQVGLAVPFLVIGAVQLNHARTTATAELGFEPKGLVAAPLDLADIADTEERAASLLRTARENLGRANGVTSVGMADGLPLDFRSRFIRVSRPDLLTYVRQTRVDEGYLTTMGIRLVRGRAFTADDRSGAELVAVITEPFAIRLFPNSDALGERITVTLEDTTTKVVTIVGVIADVVGSEMGNPRNEMLLPLAQHPTSSVLLVARTSAGSEAAATAVRSALRDVTPDFDTARIITGEHLVRESMRSMINASAVAAAGGGVALILAALGVYGVIGIMVTMRTREIAVRIALGASRRRVLRTVLTDVVKLVAPGVALGLLAAMVVVRHPEMTWYSLGVAEPLAYSVGAAIAIVVALLAGLPAARRAATVEPVSAMKSE